MSETEPKKLSISLEPDMWFEIADLIKCELVDLRGALNHPKLELHPDVEPTTKSNPSNSTETISIGGSIYQRKRKQRTGDYGD